jgi:hypothetical protein
MTGSRGGAGASTRRPIAHFRRAGGEFWTEFWTGAEVRRSVSGLGPKAAYYWAGEMLLLGRGDAAYYWGRGSEH